MNKEDIFKRIILIISFFVLLLFINTKIAQSFFGEFFAEHCMDIISVLFYIVLQYEVGMLIYGLIKLHSYKLSLFQWHNTVKILELGVDNQMSEHLDNQESYCKEDLEAECSCYLMSYAGRQTDDKVLDFLNDSFVSNKEGSIRQEELSYFFLSNLKNISVERYLNTDKGAKLLNECQLCSDAIVKRKTDIALVDEVQGVKCLANEFLHMCMPSVRLDSQDFIHYMRSVLSWVCCQLEASGFNVSTDFKILLASLPKLEEKFKYFGINDEFLVKYIKRIKRSSGLKKIISESVTQLCEQEKNLTELMCSAVFISAYPEMFNVCKQKKLRKSVKFAVLEYEKIYHKQYSKGLNILVRAIPLGSLKDPQFGLTDKLLSVISAIGGRE